ncbi:MFS transporter [Streptomyces sp. NPDC001828]|uniref:MFS transporter n=1 Tax=Streptomyces sp. NPDC001828 TaxID=3364615 RepID=UPI0036C5BCB5
MAVRNLTGGPQGESGDHRARNLTLWLSGVSLSLFGDCALWLVAGLWVKTLTGSDAAAGLTFLAYLAPGMLAPLLGIVVDRVRRRRLLIAINLVMAPTMCLALLAHTKSDVWLIYAVLLLSGLGSSLHASAGSAMLPRLAGPEGLGRANAKLRTLKEAARLCAPALGTALFATWGAASVVVIDAATYLVAAVCVCLVRVEDPKPQYERGEPVLRQMSAGVRFMWQCLPLRETALSLVGVLAVFGLVQPAVFALVSHGLHLSVTFVGVLSTCQAAGAIVGGIVTVKVVDRLGARRLLLCGLLLYLVGFAALLIPAPAGAVAGFIVIGGGVAPVVVGFYTQVQSLSPDAMLGRVSSVADSIISLPQTLFIALGSATIAAVGYRSMLLFMVAVMALSTWFYAVRLRATPTPAVLAPRPAQGAAQP